MMSFPIVLMTGSFTIPHNSIWLYSGCLEKSKYRVSIFLKSAGTASNNVRNELGEYTNVIETTLRVCNAHDTVQPIDQSKTARMVVSNRTKRQVQSKFST